MSGCDWGFGRTFCRVLLRPAASPRATDVGRRIPRLHTSIPGCFSPPSGSGSQARAGARFPALAAVRRFWPGPRPTCPSLALRGALLCGHRRRRARKACSGLGAWTRNGSAPVGAGIRLVPAVLAPGPGEVPSVENSPVNGTAPGRDDHRAPRPRGSGHRDRRRFPAFRRTALRESVEKWWRAQLAPIHRRWPDHGAAARSLSTGSSFCTPSGTTSRSICAKPRRIISGNCRNTRSWGIIRPRWRRPRTNIEFRCTKALRTQHGPGVARRASGLAMVAYDNNSLKTSFCRAG